MELLKARRSVAPLLTALAFAIAPLVGGLFMYILADPDRARRMGLIGQKAQFVGGGSDWPAYFGFLAQAATVGGFVLFAFVIAWVFGREFSDGTVRYLLALPTSRAAIIAAKLVVVALWCAALTAPPHAPGARRRRGARPAGLVRRGASARDCCTSGAAPASPCSSCSRSPCSPAWAAATWRRSVSRC